MENNNTPTQNYQSQPEMQRANPPAVTFGEWMLTILLMCIPIVNIVLLFVWAFSSSANPSKANWAKASLVWTAIVLVLYVLFFVIVLSVVGSSM